MPVPKGYWWKVHKNEATPINNSAAVYWTPMGRP